uniref:Uncharacterized protein n=1 Tax=Anguilla anguilla TaxID=7936 RepID=A0A0E9RA51_ANGAN
MNPPTEHHEVYNKLEKCFHNLKIVPHFHYELLYAVNP